MIYIYYVFAQTEYIISYYFSICAIGFVAFVCNGLYYNYYIHMLCKNVWVVSNNVTSDECDVFLVFL